MNHFPKLFRALAIVGAFTILALACSAAASETKPAFVSAEPNSFNAVTAHLDPGGNLFLYLSTEQWLRGLGDKVSGFRELLLSMPDLQGDEPKAKVNQVFDLLARVIRHSGVEDISGVGLSAISIEKGFYRTKCLVHHYPGRNAGFLWSILGKTTHPLDELDLLPATTAYACASDLDLPLVWTVVQQEVNRAGVPEAAQALPQLPAAFEQHTGLKLEDFLASLGGRYAVALTLDESRKISLPLPNGGTLSLGEPGLLIVVKVKNDLVFDRVDALLKANPQVIRTEKEGLKMRSLQVPLPVPVPLHPAIARHGDYLLLASTEQLIEAALAVQSGQANGLKATAEFKKLAQGVPVQGNQFQFISQRLGVAIGQVVQGIIQAQGGQAPVAPLLHRFLALGPQVFDYSVGGMTEEGWFSVGNGTQEPVQALLPAALAPTAIMAGMLLPALAKAKARAQDVQCANNLRQIGLAARIWATDHNDVLPADFKTMTAELASPRVLLCPGDRGRSLPPNPTWSGFDFNNVSYEIVQPVPKETEPEKVYARCRIHGTVVHADGSVSMQRK